MGGMPHAKYLGALFISYAAAKYGRNFTRLVPVNSEIPLIEDWRLNQVQR